MLILFAIISGGVLAWQYFGASKFGAPKEEVKAPGELEEPYIKVISPDGGERWVIGNSYEIKWKAENWSKEDIDEGLFISLLKYNGLECTDFSERYIITDSTTPADPRKGSYFLTISVNDRIGQTISPAPCYKIEVINARGAAKALHPDVPKISDDSGDYFSIVEVEEIADWKTYRNEKYGFEIKYPPEWDNIIDPCIQPVGSLGEIYSVCWYAPYAYLKEVLGSEEAPESGAFQIAIKIFPKGEWSSEDWVSSFVKKREINIGGIQTWRLNPKELEYYDVEWEGHIIYVPKEKLVYRIEIGDYTNEKIIEKALSTFEFLE